MWRFIGFALDTVSLFVSDTKTMDIPQSDSYTMRRKTHKTIYCIILTERIGCHWFVLSGCAHL